MSAAVSSHTNTPSVLIVDGEIISRHVIATYLRHCGYSVVEAAHVDEAYIAIRHDSLSIDVILFDVDTLGSDSGSELVSWARSYDPALDVKLVGGADMAAHTAADLCSNGPHLKKPYEPEAVMGYIEHLRANLQA